MNTAAIVLMIVTMVVMCTGGEGKPIEDTDSGDIDPQHTEATAAAAVVDDQIIDIARRGKRSGIVDQRLNDMSLIYRFKEFQRKLAKMKEIQSNAHNVNNTPAKWSYIARKFNLMRVRRSAESDLAAMEEDAELERIVNFLLAQLKRRHAAKLNRFVSPRKERRQQHFNAEEEDVPKLDMNTWKEIKDMLGEHQERQPLTGNEMEYDLRKLVKRTRT